MNEYSVYIHKNKINGKEYIGITKQSPENRWGKNGINYKNSPVFWNAICKYGWENFDHEILFSNLSVNEACQIEEDLIREHKTQDRLYGYNVMSGGFASEIPEEIRRKMSRSMMGNKNGYGKPCSEEKKTKIREAQKGKQLSEEHKKHISEAKKGKTHKPISEEARRKIADSHDKRSVLCVENNTIYPSIQECARQLGLWATLICKCCKGRLKTTGGLHFKYCD